MAFKREIAVFTYMVKYCFEGSKHLIMQNDNSLKNLLYSTAIVSYYFKAVIVCMYNIND